MSYYSLHLVFFLSQSAFCRGFLWYFRCQATNTEEPKTKRNLLDNASNLLTNFLSGGNLGSMPTAEGAVSDLFGRPLFFSLYDWFIEVCYLFCSMTSSYNICPLYNINRAFLRHDLWCYRFANRILNVPLWLYVVVKFSASVLIYYQWFHIVCEPNYGLTILFFISVIYVICSLAPSFVLILQHGSVYKLAFGPKAFVVVSDPIVARHILRENAFSYDKVCWDLSLCLQVSQIDFIFSNVIFLEQFFFLLIFNYLTRNSC